MFRSCREASHHYSLFLLAWAQVGQLASLCKPWKEEQFPFTWVWTLHSLLLITCEHQGAAFEWSHLLWLELVQAKEDFPTGQPLFLWPNLQKEVEGSPQPTYFYMASNLVEEHSNGPFGSAEKSLSTWGQWHPLCAIDWRPGILAQFTFIFNRFNLYLSCSTFQEQSKTL